MRVQNSENLNNQCSFVIRIDGEEIEIPVTFGMTADEIRMIYPFLLQLSNEKVMNPAVQFVKANEQGLMADLTPDEYVNELTRTKEQSKYWYEKPMASLLDVAVRFAVDIKMKGIEDLDFIFNRAPAYDPMSIKPVTKDQADIIMQKLHITGTKDDLDAFEHLGRAVDTPVDSTDSEITAHRQSYDRNVAKRDDPMFGQGSTIKRRLSSLSVSDARSRSAKQEPVALAPKKEDAFTSMRRVVASDSKIYDKVSAVDENKYGLKYDRDKHGFAEGELEEGRIKKFRDKEIKPAKFNDYDDAVIDDGFEDMGDDFGVVDDDDDYVAENSYDEDIPDDDGSDDDDYDGWGDAINTDDDE